ncbi:MAG: 23S rRNA (pseudouridine(1915)-N(3))-methyltransferase RlmH [Flavobacteriales bacterium]|nr:23S rRNA (pseudouridine(1915)-N(3))-methyltransferase RlmH [Flavobacteriales bacterium]
MKFAIIHIGKTSDKGLRSFIEEFRKRLSRFAKLEIIVVNSPKGKLNAEEVKQKEADHVCKHLNSSDLVVLLDEGGASLTSRRFAKMISEHFLHRSQRMTFVIGGAYGFADILQKRSNESISLSRMTFNHELALAVFVEQLYRALTIINKHPYHND